MFHLAEMLKFRLDGKLKKIKKEIFNIRKKHLSLINSDPIKTQSKILSVKSGMIECNVPNGRVGELCKIKKSDGSEILSEIVRLDKSKATLSALGYLDGISKNDIIEPMKTPHRVKVSNDLLGNILDGFGRSLTRGGHEAFSIENHDEHLKVMDNEISPLEREEISEPLITGIRAIDGLLTLGVGQRVGIFAGPGCGKTSLIAELARNINCDVIVIGLIGERGREVKHFWENEIDQNTRGKAVLVCSTSASSSMERVRAAYTATSIAEGFMKKDLHVVLLLDSITRFVRAQREIGLSLGEPAGQNGYPPSVYPLIPRLLERAGKRKNGSISAFYTILLEKDIDHDPIADEIRSLVDGHIVLSSKLAALNHFPAIDVLSSLSRIMNNIASKDHMTKSNKIKSLLSIWNENEILFRLGEYKSGNNLELDLSIRMKNHIRDFSCQEMGTSEKFSQTLNLLDELYLETK
ncbi:type III secretion protein N (ATPase) [Kluyvera sp. 1366]|jgi:type III secretion protein N (ATPase)